MLKKKQKLSSNIYELKLKFSKIIMQLRTEIVSKIIWQFELKLIKNYCITETKVEIDLFSGVFFSEEKYDWQQVCLVTLAECNQLHIIPPVNSHAIDMIQSVQQLNTASAN